MEWDGIEDEGAEHVVAVAEHVVLEDESCCVPCCESCCVCDSCSSCVCS